jgi:hypothetical protein
MKVFRIVQAVLLAWLPSHAWQAAPHAECAFFGAARNQATEAVAPGRLTRMTAQVVRKMSGAPPAPSSDAFSYPPGSIDAFLFSDMQAAGVTPAARTTDPEFRS